MMFASTLSRPRCGMPMTITSTPIAPASSIITSSIGINVPAPSREKRFCPT